MAAPATPAPSQAPVDPRSGEPVSPRRDDGAAGVSRDALFAAARAQARLGNPQAARALYRELVARYPGPGTAAVQVVLGNLEMDLGAPERALIAFQTYLRSGGPLEPEALHGKVRALHALGRRPEERATIRSYLERYPQGFQALALKHRLTELE
jgi:TolA-binding protein